MKPVHIISLAITLPLSVLLFIGFSTETEKYVSWKKFLRIASVIESYATQSVSFEGSSTSGDTVIFKLPSVAPDNTLAAGAFDRAVAEWRAGTLSLTLVPSGISFRKVVEKEFRGISKCNLEYSGSLMTFSCAIGASSYSKTFYAGGIFTPLPVGGAR
jgi:hypothetical protein